jgi:hypothetical protein
MAWPPSSSILLLFSTIIGIAHDLLDLLEQSASAQDTTGDTVGESEQSQGTDDQTHEIVERKQQQDRDDQPPPPRPEPIPWFALPVSCVLT